MDDPFQIASDEELLNWLFLESDLVIFLDNYWFPMDACPKYLQDFMKLAAYDLEA